MYKASAVVFCSAACPCSLSSDLNVIPGLSIDAKKGAYNV